jgi:methyl-accepting chemotaxis protein
MKKEKICSRIIVFTLSILFVFLYTFLSLKYYGYIILFNQGSIAGYFVYSWTFLLSMVIPVMLLFGFFFYFYFRPLEVTIGKLRRAEPVSPEELIKARKMIMKYPMYIIIFNIVGYFLVHILDLVTNGRVQYILTVREMSWFIFIMTSSGIYSFVQITIINQILAEPRELLNIYHFDEKAYSYKIGLRVKNIILFTLIAVYTLSFFVRYISLFMEKEFFYSEVKSEYIAKTLSYDDAVNEYANLVRTLSDKKVDVNEITMPVMEARSGIDDYFMFFIIASLCILGVGLISVSLFSRELVIQIQRQTNTIRSILEEKESLSRYISIIQFDEVGRLTDFINRLIENLKDILKRVKEGSLSVFGSSEKVNQKVFSTTAAVEEMVASINQITHNTSSQVAVINNTSRYLEDMLSGIDKISTNIESQVSFVTESSTAIRQIAANIAMVNESTMKTHDLSNNLSRIATEGVNSVEKTVEAIKMIEISSNKVLEIIEVLSNIASQTNLLAMNASIEAAHAREYGKGFEVVADEIRKLAETSGTHAKEITNYIKDMYEKIVNGVRMSEEAGTAFQKISTDIELTTNLVKEINFAMSEQKSGTDEILISVNAVVNATMEVKNIVTDLKVKSQAVRDSMKELTDVSAQINDATDEQNNVNKEIVSLINNVKDVSGSNIDTVKNLLAIVEGYNLD